VRRVTTIIIGAGHCGLAMSKQLGDHGIDHAVLERGEVANSWRTERWDSLRLLTPNWQSRLPGFAYSGPEPDSYMSMPEVVSYLDTYARFINVPIEMGTTVRRVSRDAFGYVVDTDRGSWRCQCVVAAGGACNIAAVPQMSNALPANIASLTPLQYRSPTQLAGGGVLIVGASASGVQLAREISASGRDVVLSVGEHVRLPRIYRGRDIKWWMDATGLMDVEFHSIDDLDRARRLPSLQLIGTPELQTIDLNTLQGIGVEVVGKLVSVEGPHVKFSGSLANVCALADLKMNRLLDSIDEWIQSTGFDQSFGEATRFAPTRLPDPGRLGLNLYERGIETVVWATGFRPDYSWLDVPVLDRKGRLQHDGGIVTSPGLYVMGLPFMRRRKSSYIDGAGDDARDLAAHMSAYMARAAA
jgi:putative flavoprotein involved in K+ transport